MTINSAIKTALVTGANKGIGFEVAKQLASQGIFVYLGSRNLALGQAAVKQLHSAGFTNTEAIQLDVTDARSVQQARAAIGGKITVLDILINNAGIYGGYPQGALDAGTDKFQAAFDTNVLGVVRVTQAFIDLMANAPEPRIVNVSSSQGSLTLHSDPNYKYYHYKGAVYLASKSAMNMYTVVLAYELRDTRFKVNAVCPGYTKTDFNGQRGTGTVAKAASRIVRHALTDQHGPSGKFFSEENNPQTGEVPW